MEHIYKCLKCVKFLSYLKNNGITTDDCYSYTSILTGDENYCLSQCTDGTPITEIYKGTYTNLTTIDQVKDYLLYQGPVVTLIEGNKKGISIHFTIIFF